MTAVSFAYLYPDDYTRVRMVNKWPGQPESAGSSKVPSIVAYHQGNHKACGSEALEYVDDSEYDLAKWFKLHLHPSSMKISDVPPPYGSAKDASSFVIPPLPQGVPITQVYSDFFSVSDEKHPNLFRTEHPEWIRCLESPQEQFDGGTHDAKWLGFHSAKRVA